MFCRKCGKEIPDDAAFCTRCGTATEAPQPDNTTDIEAQKKVDRERIIAWVVLGILLAGVFGVIAYLVASGFWARVAEAIQ